MSSAKWVRTQVKLHMNVFIDAIDAIGVSKASHNPRLPAYTFLRFFKLMLVSWHSM